MPPKRSALSRQSSGNQINTCSNESQNSFDAHEASEQLNQRVQVAFAHLKAWNDLPESERKGKKQSTVLYQGERAWRSGGPLIPAKDDFMMMLQQVLGHSRRDNLKSSNSL